MKTTVYRLSFVILAANYNTKLILTVVTPNAIQQFPDEEYLLAFNHPWNGKKRYENGSNAFTNLLICVEFL